jgi:hypothetical protein
VIVSNVSRIGSGSDDLRAPHAVTTIGVVSENTISPITSYLIHRWLQRRNSSRKIPAHTHVVVWVIAHDVAAIASRLFRVIWRAAIFAVRHLCYILPSIVSLVISLPTTAKGCFVDCLNAFEVLAPRGSSILRSKRRALVTSSSVRTSRLQCDCRTKSCRLSSVRRLSDELADTGDRFSAWKDKIRWRLEGKV